MRLPSGRANTRCLVCRFDRSDRKPNRRTTRWRRRAGVAARATLYITCRLIRILDVGLRTISARGAISSVLPGTRCSTATLRAAARAWAWIGNAPGTGLRSPETGRQNRGSRGLTRQQRPEVRHLNARKSRHIGGHSSETRKRRFVSECVVVDAVLCQPVSPCNLGNAGRF